MKYFLKAAEFILTMQQLAGMVQLECDLDVLDVSIRSIFFLLKKLQFLEISLENFNFRFI